MGPSSLDILTKGKIISVKNQNHHPAHPCKDSKSKDGYKRRTVASEVPPILISRRKDQPSFNVVGGREFLLIIPILCCPFRCWVGEISK